MTVLGVMPSALLAQGAAPAGATREGLAKAYLRMDKAYAIADSAGTISDSTRV